MTGRGVDPIGAEGGLSTPIYRPRALDGLARTGELDRGVYHLDNAGNRWPIQLFGQERHGHASLQRSTRSKSTCEPVGVLFGKPADVFLAGGEPRAARFCHHDRDCI